MTKGQQGLKFPVAWYPMLWEIETGYRLFHYRSPAGYHFLQHLCNFHHKGYRIFGKGYHIEKSINPSCYQEYLTNFEAWPVMRNFDPLEGNFRWKILKILTHKMWPVDYTHKGPVMQNFGVFFVVNMNKLLNKQLSWQLFQTWCLCDVTIKMRPRQNICRFTSYFNGLVQDCSNSTANALELLQSCTKPSIWDSTWYRWVNARKE